MRGPLTAIFCLTLAVAAYAQEPAPAGDAPAHISFIEGAVDVIHDGVSERANPPALLIEGDIVRTGNGRAEVVFGDGTLLHVDHSVELEVLSPVRLRLSEGRLIFRLSAAARTAYFVDTPGGTVRMESRGEYGISAFRDERLEVSTSRGTAEIDDGSQQVIVRAGEMVTLRPGARPQFQSFNTARLDSFSQWAHERSTGYTTSVSATHVPYELRVYGNTLDDCGRWEYLNPYGYVWYPAVGVAWRPYYNGWWIHNRYGWTWRGHDRWAWPTHHYGRWGFNGAAWYWIPSPGWGPAWVTWGVSAGYVSWAPLGWNGLPALGFWPRRDHPAYAPQYDPWRGWTVVPRDQFGPRRPVRPRAIDGNRLDDGVRSAFNMQNYGPGDNGFAVPRGPLTTPTTLGTNTRRDVPRTDRAGIVRRPPDAAPTPNAAAPAARAPERRVTDAPEYTPFYSVPRVGTADRYRDSDGATPSERRRVTDPRPAPRDNERTGVTSTRSSEDDDSNRATPRSGVVDRSPRSGTPSTQDSAGGSDNRGGSAPRAGYVRGGGSQGGGSQSGTSQGGRYGGSDAGARPRSGSGSGGSTGATTGGASGRSGGGASSGGATGRPVAGGGGGAVRRP